MASITYIEESTNRHIWFDGAESPVLPNVGHTVMLKEKSGEKIEYVVKKVTHDSGRVHVLVTKTT